MRDYPFIALWLDPKNNNWTYMGVVNASAAGSAAVTAAEAYGLTGKWLVVAEAETHEAVIIEQRSYVVAGTEA